MRKNLRKRAQAVLHPPFPLDATTRLSARGRCAIIGIGQLRKVNLSKMRNAKDVKGPAKSPPKSEETRRRILDAALELFHDKGFESATMRDIAVRAGVATGAAYYYFASKDAIVLAFYRQAAEEMGPRLEEVLAGTTDVRKRLAGILDVKLRYFESSRRLLAALAAHVDPAHPLSPFSEATRQIRERDIELFGRAIAGSRLRIPDDLGTSLPRLFWMYQMGIILYWIHDASSGQSRTRILLEKSLQLAVRLVQISGLPLMRPLRRQVIELFEAAAG